MVRDGDPALDLTAIRTRQMLAIAAIADNRLADAIDILQRLQVDAPYTVTRGECQFCGCTDRTPCSIVVASDDSEDEPLIVRCSWVDPHQTVCSNLHCLDQWRRESPSKLEVLLENAGDKAPRIIRP